MRYVDILVAFGKIYQSNSGTIVSHSGLTKTSLHDAFTQIKQQIAPFEYSYPAFLQIHGWRGYFRKPLLENHYLPDYDLGFTS